MFAWKDKKFEIIAENLQWSSGFLVGSVRGELVITTF